MVVAFKDGVVFDMRTLIIVFAGVAATTCSWMARIEASIDNLHVGEVRRNA